MIDRLARLASERTRRVLWVAGAVFLLAAALGAPVVTILSRECDRRSVRADGLPIRDARHGTVRSIRLLPLRMGAERAFSPAFSAGPSDSAHPGATI